MYQAFLDLAICCRRVTIYMFMRNYLLLSFITNLDRSKVPSDRIQIKYFIAPNDFLPLVSHDAWNVVLVEHGMNCTIISSKETGPVYQ